MIARGRGSELQSTRIMPPRLPCVLFEDAHLLVVHKPAGISTHRAGENAPWGITELLQSRRPDPARLGVHQRLDRETSGVLVFARSPEANRSLAAQFENRAVRKSYRLVTRGENPARAFTAEEPIDGKTARTRFRFIRRLADAAALWEAIPETGRTHQVRLHAAAHGLPITGDAAPDGKLTEPLLLHAAQLELIHPIEQTQRIFEAPLPGYFEMVDPDQRRFAAARALRQLLLDDADTNAFRLIHREPDGFSSITVDQLDGWLYMEDFAPAGGTAADSPGQRVDAILDCARRTATPAPRWRGAILSRVFPGIRREDKRLLWGEKPPADFSILENGIRYHLELLDSGGTGLFLDQRENRRFIRNLATGARVLNLFAYTCGFSVAAALGGAVQTVNVDLSRRVLERARRNFTANHIDPGHHRFLTEDAPDSVAEMVTRKERFDIVILDPPSSSRSKSSGHFSARRDFARLAGATAPLVAPGGWLFCSTNLVAWEPREFAAALETAIRGRARKIQERIWIPQPFDFPANAARKPYLKSIWFHLA